MESELAQQVFLAVGIVLALLIIRALDRAVGDSTRRAEERFVRWMEAHPGVSLEWDEPQSLLLTLVRLRAVEISCSTIVNTAVWEKLKTEHALLAPKNKRCVHPDLHGLLPAGLAEQLPGS